MEGLQNRTGDLGSRLTGIACGLRGLGSGGNALGPIGMFAVPALNASNDHAVSQAAYGMLAAIEEFGPASQADLGRRLGMDRRSVSEEAAGLENGAS
jgi:hypothetical protein